LDAIAAFDELRASLLTCRSSAPAELRLSFVDAHDNICRMQSEVSGAAPRIPLSSVEALGLLRDRLNTPVAEEFSVDCGIAAAYARSLLSRLAVGERRISITSETYLRRLAQLLTDLSRVR
jgi:hypothetical protein